MNFGEIDKKFKIIIIIVMILSVITFSVFMREIQNKETKDLNNEEIEQDKEIGYRAIANTSYCEKINLKPYNETHCYS
jgi:uncharacterized membrane protein YqhA